MEISNEDFDDEFVTFNVSLDNDDIYDKLRELCQLYRLDAGNICLEWVAFSHSHKNCGLTLEYLGQMERERLAKKGNKAAKTPKSSKKPPAPTNIIYDIDTLEDVVADDAEENLLGAYSTPSGKKISNKRQLTPEMSVHKRAMGMGRSPIVPFSPASLSPASSATPSKKYSGRSNSQEVVSTFGNVKGVNWKTGAVNRNTVISQFDPEAVLSDKFKYMFQKLSDKAAVLNDLIDDMAKKLQDHHGIEEYANVAFPAQDEVTVVGRVCCDSIGKLNAKSVVLEGSRDTSLGKHIPVDLSNIKQFSLFPGQVVAMDGINGTGSKFVAKKLYENIPLPLPEKRPSVSSEGLRVVVACGPFTTTDSLMYEPLADLIKYLQTYPPDVCILLGPFVDVKNPEVEKGNLSATFEDFFKRTIELLANRTQRLATQLVIVPSQRDVNHHNVFPQPPFNVSNLDQKRIHLVADPSTITIDGVVFGITSSDVLFHLGTEEISFPPGSSDRLGRLAQHIIAQHSYYPLYPSHEEMNIDYDHFDIYAKMPVTPHVLIIPSDLRYFVKDVSGCCCVNPGRLTKGQVGGTFARMFIESPSGQNINKPLVQSIKAEVLRI